MTNNLKAERTLTAEELQTLFPDGIPVIAMKVLFPEKSGPLTTEEVRLILQSLSTQQPMGEVTDEMVELAAQELLAHGEFSSIPWRNYDNAIVAARAALTAALHPNQESGE